MQINLEVFSKEGSACTCELTNDPFRSLDLWDASLVEVTAVSKQGHSAYLSRIAFLCKEQTHE